MTRLVRLVCTSAGDRPVNGRPSSVNRRRSRRIHERLDDSASWRWWLTDRDGPTGWIPDLDDEDDW